MKNIQYNLENMKLGAYCDNNPSAMSMMLRMLTPVKANSPDEPAPYIGCVGASLRQPVMDQSRNVEALRFEIQADLGNRDTRPNPSVIDEAYAGMRGINRVNNTLEGAMKEQFLDAVKQNRIKKLAGLENQQLTAEQKQARIEEDLNLLGATLPAPIVKAADMSARDELEGMSFGDGASTMDVRDFFGQLAGAGSSSYTPSAMSRQTAEELQQAGLYKEADAFKDEEQVQQGAAAAAAAAAATPSVMTGDPIDDAFNADARQRYAELAAQSPAMMAAAGEVAERELRQLDSLIQAGLISGRQPNWGDIAPLMGALRSNSTRRPQSEATAMRELRELRAAFRRSPADFGQKQNNLVNKTNLKNVVALG